jgi:hypothetical protein
MTANELADLIENEDTLWLEPHLNTIATMLRQKTTVKELTDEEILDTARTMPVIDGATMEEAYVLFARAILSKAQGVNDKQ